MTGTIINVIWLAENAVILGMAVWLCVRLGGETVKMWRNKEG